MDLIRFSTIFGNNMVPTSLPCSMNPKVYQKVRGYARLVTIKEINLIYIPISKQLPLGQTFCPSYFLKMLHRPQCELRDLCLPIPELSVGCRHESWRKTKINFINYHINRLQDKLAACVFVFHTVRQNVPNISVYKRLEQVWQVIFTDSM